MENLNYRFEVRYVQRPDRLDCIVEYPDFPGVFGSGNNEAEAIADAKEALKTYFSYLAQEHLPMPSPLMGNLSSELSGKLSLRLPKGLHKKVAERAQKENVSINQVLNEAIASYIYGNMALDIYKTCFQQWLDTENPDVLKFSSPEAPYGKIPSKTSKEKR